jgi:hypothetical protein
VQAAGLLGCVCFRWSLSVPSKCDGAGRTGQDTPTCHADSVQWHTGQGLAVAGDGDIESSPCNRGSTIGAAVLVEVLPQSHRALHSSSERVSDEPKATAEGTVCRPSRTAAAVTAAAVTAAAGFRWLLGLLPAPPLLLQ